MTKVTGTHNPSSKLNSASCQLLGTTLGWAEGWMDKYKWIILFPLRNSEGDAKKIIKNSHWETWTDFNLHDHYKAS